MQLPASWGLTGLDEATAERLYAKVVERTLARPQSGELEMTYLPEWLEANINAGNPLVEDPKVLNSLRSFYESCCRTAPQMQGLTLRFCMLHLNFDKHTLQEVQQASHMDVQSLDLVDYRLVVPSCSLARRVAQRADDWAHVRARPTSRRDSSCYSSSASIKRFCSSPAINRSAEECCHCTPSQHV